MRACTTASVIVLLGIPATARPQALPVFPAHVNAAPAAPTPPPRVLPDSLAAQILARSTTSSLFDEDFENADIPGPRWNSFDSDHASGDDYWGAVWSYDGHPVHVGVRSAYCAAHSNRTDGRYDNDMNAVLVNRAPIYNNGGDLVIRFYYWLDSESDADYLYMDTSSDSVSWVSTTLLTGHLGGWRMEQVVVTGSPRLWLRFVFASDHAVTTTGAYVDDVEVLGTQPPGPDLAWVTPPGWSSPVGLSRYPGSHVELAPNAGVPTYFDLAVANVGGSPSPPTLTRVLVDGVPLFYVATPPLSPGSVAIADDIARTVSPVGYHTVEGLADADQDAGESDELNNSEFRVVYFAAPPRPDLRFRSISASPEIALPGEAVTVTAVLENAGEVMSLLTRIGFYWNRSTPPPPGAAPDSTAIVDNLMAGEQRAYRVTRVGAVDTTRPIYVRADVFGFEAESNEDNNLAGPVDMRWRALQLWARDLGTGGAVGLRWTRFPGVSYRLERGDLPSPGTLTPFATTGDTTWVDGTLETNVPHRYRITAMRNGQAAASSFEAIATPRLPLVLVHGAMIFSRDFLSYWVDTLAYWGNWRFMLSDPAAPATRFEHVWTPRLPRQAAIEESEAMLSDYVDARMDGLARWNQQEFGVSARPRQVLAIGHSAGGFYLRRLMHRRHGVVARLVMLATPNGGTALAYPLILAMHQPAFVILDPLHGCLGRTLICQCTPLYTQLIFNRAVHRDPTPGVRYEAVAGNSGPRWAPLFLGQENDGVVTVNSVYDHAVFPQAYPRHVVGLLHSPIRSDAATLAHEVYPLLTDRPWDYAVAPEPTQWAQPPLPAGAAWQMVEAVADSAPTGAARVLSFTHRGLAPLRFSAVDADGAEVDLVVCDPAGAVYDSARASHDPRCTFERWTDDAFVAGKSIAIDPAGPGTWQATVTVRSTMAAPSLFVVTMEESSSVSLTLDPPAIEVRLLDPYTMRARLDSAGASMAGAQVSVQLMAPDGSRRGTRLFDDGAHYDGPAGDGWYGGALTAMAPAGVYSMLVTATGVSFVRRAAGSLVVGEADLVPPTVRVTKPNDPWDALFPEAPYLIQWSASDSAGVDSVALWFSLEDGSAHVPIASGLPASGEYLWRVPGALVGHFGRVHALAFDRALNAGDDASDFPIPVIELVGQAPPRPPAFGLRLLSANPTRARVVLEASASERGRARLEVFDLTGRRVRRLLEGTVDAGSRRVEWALDRDDGLAVGSGIYWARWRAGGRTQTRSVVVLR